MLLLALLTALVIGVTIHPGSQLRDRPRVGAAPVGGGAVVRHLPLALPGDRPDHAAERPAQCGAGHPPDRCHLRHRRAVVALCRTAGPPRLARSAVGPGPAPPVDLAPVCEPVGWVVVGGCPGQRRHLRARAVRGRVGFGSRPGVPGHKHRARAPPPRHPRRRRSVPWCPVSTTTTTPPPAGQDVTAIGDSIMVDAAPYLQQMLPGIAIDAQVGQQLYQVQDAVPQLKAEGAVGEPPDPRARDQWPVLRGPDGGSDQLPRPHAQDRPGQHPGPTAVAAAGQRHHRRRRPAPIPNATVVNWYADSAAYPQYFYPDGVHLDPSRGQVLRVTARPGGRGPTPSPSPDRAAHRDASHR